MLTSGDSPGKSRQPHTFHYFLLLHCRIDTVYSGPKSALGVRGTQSIRFTHANLLGFFCVRVMVAERMIWASNDISDL